MPIILWGSRGLTKRLGRGDFHCPHCDQPNEYTLAQEREWFTLYFIPIFPMGGAQRYVECHGCGSRFTEEVLQAPPPEETDRNLARVYRDMEEGESLEEAEARLGELGFKRDQALEIIRDMGRGDAWRCERCGQHYLKVVRSCRRCQAG